MVIAVLPQHIKRISLSMNHLFANKITRVAAATLALVCSSVRPAYARPEVLQLGSWDRTALETPGQTLTLTIPAVGAGLIALDRRLRVELIWTAASRNVVDG